MRPESREGYRMKTYREVERHIDRILKIERATG
jgi:hypothetical protein